MTKRVLVAYATKMGTTGEIAEEIGAELTARGLETEVAEVRTVRDVAPYDAVVVGSGLYANHWRREAVKFVRANADALARRPVWVFHSGPIGEDLDQQVPAPARVAPLLERIGAHGPTTFAGALLPERAKGFIAKKVAASKVGGDYRDHEAIRAWADEIADALAVAA